VRKLELIDIPGIGPKTIIELKKLNILNISDLIEYYPFRYEVIKRTNLREVKTDDKIYIDGIIESYPSLFHFGSNKSRLSFKLNTGSELININVFNQSFLKPKLNPGVTITVGGKINKGKTGINASEIRFEGLNDKEKIEGVYSRTKNLSSKKIHSYIDYVITNSNIEVPTYIPDYLNEKYDFKDKNECIKEIHKPTSRKNLEVCSKILK